MAKYIKKRVIIRIAAAAVIFTACFSAYYYLTLPVQAKLCIDRTNYSPGEVIVVGLSGNLQAAGKMKSSSVDFCGQEARFYDVSRGSGTVYRALLAVPLEGGLGRDDIAVFVKFGFFRKFRGKLNVDIEEKKFARTHLGTLSREGETARRLQEESRVTRQLRSIATPGKLWHNKFIMPALGRLTSRFGGMRTFGKKRVPSRHNGLDIAAPSGTAVFAANNGVVKMAAKFKALGNTVLLDHGQGVYSIYMHLKTIGVHRTASVEKGALIGTVGSTGHSTGPHLHWGIYVNSVPVDPIPWTETEID